MFFKEKETSFNLKTLEELVCVDLSRASYFIFVSIELSLTERQRMPIFFLFKWFCPFQSIDQSCIFKFLFNFNF